MIGKGGGSPSKGQLAGAGEGPFLDDLRGPEPGRCLRGQRPDLFPGALGGNRIDPSFHLRFFQFVFVECQKVPGRIDPEIEEQICSPPDPALFEDTRGQNVRVGARERSVGSMEDSVSRAPPV